jgi:hypothetical protein
MDSVRGFEVGLYAGKKPGEIRITKKRGQTGVSEVFVVRLVVVRNGSGNGRGGSGLCLSLGLCLRIELVAVGQELRCSLARLID